MSKKIKDSKVEITLLNNKLYRCPKCGEPRAVMSNESSEYECTSEKCT